ncbi:hypothetical protein IMG5_171930 [Ichthyophthirius multifiliis]|uniref:glutamine--tRNA ligase n=1 Tax=Ichthyophthirius multifiliis TaxID=5932 RepID=G0R1P5_ICHMU|nr:hypothetical protein IMG5_171930 [Ichthyophthirius multifiliis]EGR28605.1 hypothetical protein IMG5_171930 [Ichthyophthirius multifiliis]|eukprot:XP_004029841.1 hypothetical protein IMG5_171930 [Ichthyophthirius multifiliis]
MESELEKRLKSINLDEKIINDVLKNKQLTQSLTKTLDCAQINECDKKKGNMLYSLATKIDLEKVCGIGISLSEEQISQKIREFLTTKKAELDTLRYCTSISEYMKNLREILPFADAKEESQKHKKTAQNNNNNEENNTENNGQFQEEPRKKITDLIGRDLAAAQNTPELLQLREKTFGNVILTRFPPEPNGYLHIGHAKSIRFNFTVASDYKGKCYLRFDDTNPEKENMEYINSIKDNVKWLGYEPWKVTYSSDNFDILYQYAVKLIKKGLAYVCHQNIEDGRKYRDEGLPSPYRDRPIEQNLKVFEEMRLGLWDEGSAVLRAKIDYKSPNTTLRDPAIYRIRYVSHPHAGNKWCIYPLYDYTHPICDSLEGITHSLCTLEFEIRRELYYWYLKSLQIYRPYVWEFSRLNVSSTVLSKRKLQTLVFDKHVNGWDDPRLLTIQGMRRRGYTPAGINDFCELVSVTRSGNENIIQFQLLEHCIRKDLDNVAKRTLAVVDPVLVKIVNLDDNFSLEIDAPDFPKYLERGSHKITLFNQVWVEREDTLMKDHKDFFGFAKGKIVGLKYAGVFKCLDVKADQNGVVQEVLIEFIKENAPKPKTYVNWVSVKESLDCQVRLYECLFNEDPTESKKDLITIINKNSLVVKKNAKMNKRLVGLLNHLDRFQFERQGFFTVDFDSDLGKQQYVWNKTVGLSDTGRQKAMARVNQDN